MSECLTRSADRPERAHYGLAVYCAKRFFGRGVPREELIGEAEAALLWAAARFDARRGVRFSTYAIPFVLGALRELCRRAGPMHVPRAEARILTAVESARGKLNAREGREPTVRELAQAVGVEPGLLGEMLAARDRMRRTDGALDVRKGCRKARRSPRHQGSVCLKRPAPWRLRYRPNAGHKLNRKP